MLDEKLKDLFPKNTDVITSINGIINRLKRKRVYRVSPAGNPLTPKVLWKYQCYIQISLHRIVDISLDACLLTNSGRIISCLMLTRALFEHNAINYELFKNLEENLSKKNFKKIDEEIMTKLFGSRVDIDVYFPRMPNILNSIDKITEEIPDYRNHYENFCEIYHPNYLGMHGFYAIQESDPPSMILNKSLMNNENFSIFTTSFYALLHQIEEVFEKIESLYPALWTLCDEEYEKQKPQKNNNK